MKIYLEGKIYSTHTSGSQGLKGRASPAAPPAVAAKGAEERRKDLYAIIESALQIKPVLIQEKTSR